MPGRQRRGFTTRSTGYRAPTNWARAVSPVYAMVPAATKVLLFTAVLSNPGINETIRRTRGLISIRSVDTGDIQRLGSLGFIVVNDLAAAAGVASMPGPITDGSDDGWFVWQPVLSGKASAAILESEQFEFDSKAMRRIEEGFTIAVIAENAHATLDFEVAIGFSILTSLT